MYGSPERWKAQLAELPVRLQWDPDHDPSGSALVRRAVQLGLRGKTLRQFAGEWTIDVEDISAFVAEQREHRGARLVTPRERVYPVTDAAVAQRLGLDRI